MLSLPTYKRSHPTLLECGHWSYWLEKVDGQYECSACGNKYIKEISARKTKSNAKLLEHL